MGAQRTRDARGKLCSVDFAEVVLYWVPRTVKPPAIVEEQLLEGILIGVRDNSNKVFILNEHGLFTARSVETPGSWIATQQRRSWQSAPQGLEIDWFEPTHGPFAMPAIGLVAPEKAAQDRRLRLFIMVSDLAEHGNFEGCSRCNASQTKAPQIGHFEAC